MNRLLLLLCFLANFGFANIWAASPQTTATNFPFSLEKAENKGINKVKTLVEKLLYKHKNLSPSANLTYQDKLVVFGTGLAGAILSTFLLVNGATYLAAAILLLGLSAALYIFWMKTGKGPKWLPRLPY